MSLPYSFKAASRDKQIRGSFRIDSQTYLTKAQLAVLEAKAAKFLTELGDQLRRANLAAWSRRK